MKQRVKFNLSPRDLIGSALFIILFIWMWFLSDPRARFPETSLPSADENAVLLSPQNNASEEEKWRYYELVARLAKESKIWNVSQCRPQPTALRVKKGENIVVKNDDTAPRVIAVGEHQKQYVIPPGSQLEVKVDFGGIGVFGVGCDMFERGVGIIFVAE